MKRKVMTLAALGILLSASLNPVWVYGMEVGGTEASSTEETTGSTTEETNSSTEETTSGSETTETTESSSQSSTPEVPKVEETTPSVEPSAPAPQAPAATPAPTVPVEAQSAEPADIHVVKDLNTETFIRRIGEKARKIGQEQDLYASVMIAQAILETGSGGSLLSQEPYFNLFGIKGAYEEQSVVLPTYEDDGAGNWYQIDAAFKQYPGYKESFEDYAKLMKDGITEGQPSIYEGTWKSHTVSYQEATKALTGVYATDTQYDQKLNAFIEEYELTEYDKAEPSLSASGLIVTDSHPDSDFKDYSGEEYAGSEYYAAGNCTQYVYNRIVQLDGYVEVNMGNGMDWGATGKANGYEVSHEPKAGTALSFQPGVCGADRTYGHVAFVEHVYEDGSILISEMNAAGLGIVSFRVLDAQTANTLTYVTPK